MFKALLKKQMRELFGSFARGKNGRATGGAKVGFIILYVICFISLGFAFWGMSILYADTILPTGQNWLYYSMCSATAVALSVLGTSFAAFSSLYNARDTEILLSLPIKPEYILYSRSLSIYLLDLLFEVIVMIPAMLVYWFEVGATLVNVISPIILTLALSLLILCFSCFFGWVIAVASSKIKNKTAARVILFVVLFGGYYVFYFNANKVLTSLLANAMKAKLAIHLVGDAGIGKIIPLIIVIAIIAAIFVLTFKLLSMNFIKISTTKVTTKKTEYKRNANVKQSSLSKTLLRKELKRLLSSSTYLINGAFGVLAMPIGAVLLLIKAKDIKPLLAIVPTDWLIIIAFTIIAVMSCMNNLSSSSISLEGKNFWIIKTLPVDAFSVINAKITLHEVMTFPPAIISGAIVCAVMGLDWSSSVNVLAAVLIYIILLAQVGVALNLKMPKLDWVNETYAVKNSIPAMISLFGGWLAACIFGGLFYLVRNFIDAQSYMVALLVIMALLTRFIGKWLRTNGVELFEALN